MCFGPLVDGFMYEREVRVESVVEKAPKGRGKEDLEDCKRPVYCSLNAMKEIVPLLSLI